MTGKQTTLEIIAPTIDEAVSKGLAELGLPLEAIDVEILDEGSRGFLGIGGRQAMVRLTVKPDSGAVPQVAEPARVKREPQPEGAKASAPAPSEPTTAEAIEDEAEWDERAVMVARETVEELLEKMNIEADVTARFGEWDETGRRRPLHIEIHGRDLSILIGRRAATLNALQYITKLIVSKELGRSVFLVVDVEGYRARRERQLRQLARRMAEQAIQTGRRQILEPMPANERRIIHIELRDHPQVSTESIGEEPRRKVTIIPL